MPKDIESKAFRAAAQNNSVVFRGLHIYMENPPDLDTRSLVEYQEASDSGAVTTLMASLANAQTQIQQIREGLAISEATAMPGVSYRNSGPLSITLDGIIYCMNANEAASVMSTINTLAHDYGWGISAAVGARVYAPKKKGLYNNDPAKMAIKAMVMHAISDIGDASTLMDAATSKASNTSDDQAKDIAAAEARLKGGSISDSVSQSWHGNQPTAVQNSWKSVGGNIARLVEGVVVQTSPIGFAPAEMSVSYDAFILENGSLYPTEIKISLKCSNPLGGILSACSDGIGEDNSSGAVNVTPDRFLVAKG